MTSPTLSIAQFAIVVKDYDEAIAFYCEKLGFHLKEDTQLTPQKRWVVISSKESSGCDLLLAKGATEHQLSRLGDQTGGRVFVFMHTQDFDADFQSIVEKGVEVIREPVLEKWGKVAVIADLYGNLIDLIDPSYSQTP